MRISKHQRILEFANLNIDKAKHETENTVENYLVRECRKRRALVFKLQTVYIGLFDRFIVWYACDCHFSNIDWIEAKRPKGGKYGPHQEYWRDEFIKRGCNAGTLRTKDEIDKYIKARTCEHTRIIKPQKDLYPLHTLARSKKPRALNALKRAMR